MNTVKKQAKNAMLLLIIVIPVLLVTRCKKKIESSNSLNCLMRWGQGRQRGGHLMKTLNAFYSFMTWIINFNLALFMAPNKTWVRLLCLSDFPYYPTFQFLFFSWATQWVISCVPVKNFQFQVVWTFNICQFDSTLNDTIYIFIYF